MRKDDLIRLRHMLAAANDALNFADEKPRDELDWNRMLALSVIKSVEIVGVRCLESSTRHAGFTSGDSLGEYCCYEEQADSRLLSISA